MLRAIACLVAIVAWPATAGASMRCQGLPTDAALVAGGGAIVTGQIIEAGRDGANRDSGWARLKVLERRAGAAPDIIRLWTNDGIVSNFFFVVGKTHTLALREPFGDAFVSRCDGRSSR
ncbi:MAG TPA: hypothetical protein VJR58_10235 [Vineibacter sp.]|nr:hypothetical protein [Vineibacter sp.]